MPKFTGEKPDWWYKELYDFTKNMPLEGWVWEFARRAALKEILKGAPVDAMNPDPDLSHMEDEAAENYYISWHQAIERFGYWGHQPFYRVPAVRFSRGFPPDFRGQPIQIPSPHGEWIDISINIKRRDTTIRKDFMGLLKLIRIQQKMPQPKQIKPRTTNWTTPLMAWDLYQFGVPFLTIASLLDIHADPDSREFPGPEDNIDKVSKTYDKVSPYIDEGRWEELVPDSLDTYYFLRHK